MGFLNGRVTALRFQVTGPTPPLFDEEHLDRLRDHQIGRERVAAADGSECGWTAGRSVLDTSFDLAKQVVNDSLHFDFRVDTNKPDPALLKAYYEAEVTAFAKGNPSGFPSAKQKREAKEIARERLEQEGKDGRFRKRKCTPVMWDRDRRQVLFGTASTAQVDRFVALFEVTFGVKLGCVTAGDRARLVWDHPARGAVDPLESLAPAPFLRGRDSGDVAWIASEDNRDWLGNEFLLWLWYTTDTDTDTVKCPDGQETTFMFSGGLKLDDPRGVSGHDTMNSDSAVRLPEARTAVRAGKLPRKAALTVVRLGQQFSFVLDAERLALGAAKLPPPGDELTEARARLEERVTQVRDLCETLDQLYGAFVGVRVSSRWPAVLSGMQSWLAPAKAA